MGLINKKRILIVEDDADMRSLLRDFLTHRGYAVRIAASAPIAIRLLGELTPSEAPDVVLSDVRMAPVSGLELARWIARNAPALPIVLMSVFGEAELGTSALECGADAFLRKPFLFASLDETLREVLARPRRR